MAKQPEKRAGVRIMTREPLLIQAKHVEPLTFLDSEVDRVTEAELMNCVIANRATFIRDDEHYAELKAQADEQTAAAEAALKAAKKAAKDA